MGWCHDCENVVPVEFLTGLDEAILNLQEAERKLSLVISWNNFNWREKIIFAFFSKKRMRLEQEVKWLKIRLNNCAANLDFLSIRTDPEKCLSGLNLTLDTAATTSLVARSPAGASNHAAEKAEVCARLSCLLNRVDVETLDYSNCGVIWSVVRVSLRSRLTTRPAGGTGQSPRRSIGPFSAGTKRQI